jgi:hypothetical protein
VRGPTVNLPRVPVLTAPWTLVVSSTSPTEFRAWRSARRADFARSIGAPWPRPRLYRLTCAGLAYSLPHRLSRLTTVVARNRNWKPSRGRRRRNLHGACAPPRDCGRVSSPGPSEVVCESSERNRSSGQLQSLADDRAQLRIRLTPRLAPSRQPSTVCAPPSVSWTLRFGF